jgi:purine-binding chemotaxis protein CheW
MAVPRDPRQFVTFFLMGEEYGVDIQLIREIVEYEPITYIPAMPRAVRGVMNLRGSVVPVIDLPPKLGHAETPLGQGTYILVLDLSWSGESIRIGLLTRTLGQVVDAEGDDIKPVPDFGTRIRVEYLMGIVRADARFVLLLDVDRLFSPAELLEIAALPAAPPSSAATPAANPDLGRGTAERP